jgi:hypothetical protein
MFEQANTSPDIPNFIDPGESGIGAYDVPTGQGVGQPRLTVPEIFAEDQPAPDTNGTSHPGYTGDDAGDD